jgi:cellobiose epimerase
MGQAMNQSIHQLYAGMKSDLIQNILPFWSQKMIDNSFGGFHGRMNGKGELIGGAEKGGILNARILWTFSAAYFHLHDPVCKRMAERSRNYMINSFFDREFGGTYWKITFDGKPLETKKQIYSQAFFIYALAEYYRAVGDRVSLKEAVSLYRLIEERSFDRERNGYFEAYSREWNLLQDLRLSAKDVNEKKTTNTHLHILEAYTGLFRIWKDDELGRKLKNLVRIFLDKIIDPVTHHLRLFFDESWESKSLLISYGHDIEASWLIYEAAKALDDTELLNNASKACISLANAALEGFQSDGSLIYETDPETGHTDMERHWWPQAEAIVGLANLYELTGNEGYLAQAIKCWDYISRNLIDSTNGEWYWSINPDGTPNLQDDKAGFWKCPYHNGRACLEIMDRYERMSDF